MVIRKRPVGLEIQAGETSGDLFEERWEHDTRNTVSGVGRYRQVSDPVRSSDLKHMIDVPLPGVGAVHHPGRNSSLDASFGETPHVPEPGIDPHGCRTRKAQLDPVPALGVVRGGDHCRGFIEHSGGVVRHVGGDHAKRIDIAPRPDDPRDECVGQQRR